MTEATQNALIVAMAPTILALATLVAQLRAKSDTKNARKVYAARAEQQKEATAEVHALVNDKSEKQDTRIDALRKEILRLQGADTQTPSAVPDRHAPVTLDGGMVTVDPRPARSE